MTSKVLRMALAALAATPVLALDAAASSAVDPGNRHAYAANAGWVDCRADGTDGLAIGEMFCSGYTYAANLGWMCLGNGAPTNGYRYLNDSASDIGVNREADGRLRGCAWGANFGWVAFEEQGNPRVNLASGRLAGYAWSPNIGWIDMGNAWGGVTVTNLAAGADADGDGIPDAWEIAYSGSTGSVGGSSGTDSDNDGVSDRDEYIADTDPLSPSNAFEIVALQPVGAQAALTFRSRASRQYRVEVSTNLVAGWGDAGLGSVPPDSDGLTSVALPSAPGVFYRMVARPPLGQ